MEQESNPKTQLKKATLKGIASMQKDSNDADSNRMQAQLHLMRELAKGRRSGEEDGWISSENVRNHFRARVK